MLKEGDKETKKEERKRLAVIASERAKRSAGKLKEEMKKSTNTAIIAAFSFLIALAWKDLITEYVNKISAASPIQGVLISTLLITLICVIGILIITRFLSPKEETV
jgi:hypothetical protein